jgi:hypothetical protein
LRVIELDAVAASGRLIIALAGDDVVADLDVLDCLDIDAKQVIGQVAVAYHGTIRARPDVDAGILVHQAVARIAHDHALNHHILGGDADGVAFLVGAYRGPVYASQRQGFVDQQVLVVGAAFHPHHVAGFGLRNRRRNGLARVHRKHVGRHAGGSQQAAPCNEQGAAAC